jgi:hypothetical protein
MVTKFTDGAWVVAVAIPIFIAAFYSIHRHYDRVAAALSTVGLTDESLNEIADVVIVPIADIHRGTLLALKYAKRISKNVRAITVATSPEMKDRFMTRWNRFPQITTGIDLLLIEYDFRDILIPLVDYIEHVNTVEFCDKITTVVVPEFIPEMKSAKFLHNQTANRLRSRLIDHKDIVVIEVPFHIDSQLEKIACETDLEAGLPEEGQTEMKSQEETPEVSADNSPAKDE